MIVILTEKDLVISVARHGIELSEIEFTHLNPHANESYRWADLVIFIKDNQFKIIKNRFGKAAGQILDLWQMDWYINQALGQEPGPISNKDELKKEIEASQSDLSQAQHQIKRLEHSRDILRAQLDAVELLANKQDKTIVYYESDHGFVAVYDDQNKSDDPG